MGDMIKRFEQEYSSLKFTINEVTGFASNPKLAVLAGMAAGYRMACEDIGVKIESKLNLPEDN